MTSRLFLCVVLAIPTQWKLTCCRPPRYCRRKGETGPTKWWSISISDQLPMEKAMNGFCTSCMPKRNIIVPLLRFASGNQVCRASSLGQAPWVMRMNQRLSRDDASVKNGPHLNPTAWAGRMGGIESFIPWVSISDQDDATRCLFERRVGGRWIELVMAVVKIWEGC